MRLRFEDIEGLTKHTIMKKNEKIVMAAILVATHLPLSAAELICVSREYGVDHREVMTEVKEMLDAESLAENDMEGEL